MHVCTTAFRTLDLVLFIFRKSEDDFKWLLAIFAEKFVSRHGDPHRTPQTHSTAPEASHDGDENDAPQTKGNIAEIVREGE